MKVIPAPTATLNDVGGWTRLIIAASQKAAAPNASIHKRNSTIMTGAGSFRRM
jgi:hypothetical protein